jgi:F420-non-reducing hydrogenase small subunit
VDQSTHLKKEEKQMTVKIASEWLNACSGCEISIVDMGERLLDVLNLADFVHIPVIMDHKYFGQTGEGRHMEIPEADVGIISGGVRNEEHLEVAREMRKKCGLIIALGTCATHGGIPALSNSYTNQDLLSRYYTTESTTPTDAFPKDGVPPLLDAAYALDEKIKVDIYLPGCAPHPDQISKPWLLWLKASRLFCGEKAFATLAPPSAKAKDSSNKCVGFYKNQNLLPKNLSTKCAACWSKVFCVWAP